MYLEFSMLRSWKKQLAFASDIAQTENFFFLKMVQMTN
jgi:hypothetical protein